MNACTKQVDAAWQVPCHFSIRSVEHRGLGLLFWGYIKENTRFQGFLYLNTYDPGKYQPSMATSRCRLLPGSIAAAHRQKRSSPSQGTRRTRPFANGEAFRSCLRPSLLRRRAGTDGGLGGPARSVEWLGDRWHAWTRVGPLCIVTHAGRSLHQESGFLFGNRA